MKDNINISKRKRRIINHHKQVIIYGKRKNGEQFQIECDKHIAPLIKLLNEKGFYTLFSCQDNRPKNFNYKSPYIMIKMPKSRKKTNQFIQEVRKFYNFYKTLQITYNVYNYALTIHMVQNDYKGKINKDYLFLSYNELQKPQIMFH